MKQEDKLKRKGDIYFAKMFDSLQLLGFTVLYYDFDFSTEQMTEYNKKMIEVNKVLLEDEVLFNNAKNELSEIWGKRIEEKAKEFPYRSKMKIIGGVPKGGMQYINLAMWEIGSAIESYLTLAFSTIREKDNTFTKEQMDLFYETLKENSMNYAKGMKDDFIVNYFKEQLHLDCERE